VANPLPRRLSFRRLHEVNVLIVNEFTDLDLGVLGEEISTDGQSKQAKQETR